MALFGGSGVFTGAAIATVIQELATHPVDTLITRIQSPKYAAQYKQTSGLLHGRLFHGLYQGFGPTLLAGIPASIAFFSMYEGSKELFEHVPSVPPSLAHAVSSAAADIVACAVINPAEVLKQNAQVSRRESVSSRGQSHIRRALRRLLGHPARLWTGYSMLVASSLPGTSLTFCLYESLKAGLLPDDTRLSHDILYRAKISAVSAGLAAGCTSCLFVPVDVVKTRMRLAPMGAPGRRDGKSKGPLVTARQILRAEGARGLFRGLTLTCLASAWGAGLYLGCYEACKMYFGGKADATESAA